jgi:hypothetical protein
LVGQRYVMLHRILDQQLQRQGGYVPLHQGWVYLPHYA